MNLSESNTRFNLLRAFAGESQARNRYTFAAEVARQARLQLIEQVFLFTADQERAHAKAFYDALRAARIENLEICAGYPVDLETDVPALLNAAAHNEAEEHAIVYPDFARTARAEGFGDIAFLFEEIAAIEGAHEARFRALARLMDSGELFKSAQTCRWLCLNCGNVIESAEPPAVCPVCKHDQGFYIREVYAPFTGAGC